MKKEFESVEIEIVLFSTDVITASDPIVGGDDPLDSVNINL